MASHSLVGAADGEAKARQVSDATACGPALPRSALNGGFSEACAAERRVGCPQ